MAERPKELQSFLNALARDAFGAAPVDVPGKCISCREPFSASNVFTPAGWREVSISGLCEKCFDEITKDIDEDFPPGSEEYPDEQV